MLWRGLGYLPCLHTGTAAVPSVAERPQRRSQLQELLTLKTGLHTKGRRARSNLSISILLTTAIVATGSTMFVLDRARATAPSLGWAWSGSMRFAFRPPWCSWSFVVLEEVLEVVLEEWFGVSESPAAACRAVARGGGRRGDVCGAPLWAMSVVR